MNAKDSCMTLIPCGVCEACIRKE